MWPMRRNGSFLMLVFVGVAVLTVNKQLIRPSVRPSVQAIGRQTRHQPLGASSLHWHPTWESLRKHQPPPWFRQAKFGIFIHWGIYSVPGFAPPRGEFGKVEWTEWFKNNPYAEWYFNSMNIEGSETWKYHRKHYPNRTYVSFVRSFNLELAKWNPQVWADLFYKVHAKYVVLTTKHHDGFTLWPSEVPNPSWYNVQGSNHSTSFDRRINTDVVGRLATAVRARGLRMGTYYSGGADWSFHYEPIRTKGVPKMPQSKEYAAYADAHMRELIARYKPDILWSDLGYPPKGHLTNILADYYNFVSDGVVNNRFRPNQPNDVYDFSTPEYSHFSHPAQRKYESCRGLGFSFGFNRMENASHVISKADLIGLLVGVVATNGNLLLNIGPRADGSLPEIQQQRLLQLGAWLDVNGEAIFNSTPLLSPLEHEILTAEGVKCTLLAHFEQSTPVFMVVFLGTNSVRFLTVSASQVGGKCPSSVKHMLGTRRRQISVEQSGSRCVLNIGDLSYVPSDVAFSLELNFD